jgi:hypothetical protein
VREHNRFPTTNTGIVVFIAITDKSTKAAQGGYKVVGDSSTGLHRESLPSCWNFCAPSGIAGTVKFGNTKFEPGLFIDGTWNIYVVDGSGKQVSPVVSLPYNSTDKNQWVWDFVMFSLK